MSDLKEERIREMQEATGHTFDSETLAVLRKLSATDIYVLRHDVLKVWRAGTKYGAAHGESRHGNATLTHRENVHA